MSEPLGSPTADDWQEVRRRIRALEERLRRGRLTVPTYLAATVFFLVSARFTEAWGPAVTLAGMCLVAAWIMYGVRRRRMERLRGLEELSRALPEAEPDPET